MLSKILTILSHSSFYNFSIDFCDVTFPIVDTMSFSNYASNFSADTLRRNFYVAASILRNHAQSKINSNSTYKNYL